MPGPHKPSHTAKLAIALPCAFISAGAGAEIPAHHLDNGTVRAVVTEAIGGRLLSFGLADRHNFLKVDERAGNPDAPPDVRGDNVAYFGQEVWAGPQKQWWSHQTANPERAAAHAPWPPDPYLTLAKYKLAHKDATSIAVDGPASPVNGLQLHKTYALVPGKPNSLRLDVTATNKRAAQVAWDIWFNTRAHADTRVYLPVASKDDVRQEPVGVHPADVQPLTWTIEERIFSLDIPEAGPTTPPRNGKVFVQPAAGWMAGFHGGQVLIVQFTHQPRSAIHPDQGQVELYNDFQPQAMERGLMEMEVHAPYVHLAPGAKMAASELWTILPYDGPTTRAAHVAFLRAHAKGLGLDGL
jgi:hypothetical protein